MATDQQSRFKQSQVAGLDENLDNLNTMTKADPEQADNAYKVYSDKVDSLTGTAINATEAQAKKQDARQQILKSKVFSLAEKNPVDFFKAKQAYEDALQAQGKGTAGGALTSPQVGVAQPVGAANQGEQAEPVIGEGATSADQSDGSPSPINQAIAETQPAPRAPMEDKSLPVSIRSGNPGAMWPGSSAMKFGSTRSLNLADGQGNKIAVFDNPVAGAAAQFDLLSQKYVGKTLGAAIRQWSGGNSSEGYAKTVADAMGISSGDRLTPEILNSPKGVVLARAMAKWEAGREFPLSDDQWRQAQAWAFNGQKPQSQAIAHDVDLKSLPTLEGSSIQPADVASLSPKDYDGIDRALRPYFTATLDAKMKAAVNQMQTAGSQTAIDPKDLDAAKWILGPKVYAKFSGQLSDAQDTWAVQQTIQNMTPQQQSSGFSSSSRRPTRARRTRTTGTCTGRPRRPRSSFSRTSQRSIWFRRAQYRGRPASHEDVRRGQAGRERVAAARAGARHGRQCAAPAWHQDATSRSWGRWLLKTLSPVWRAPRRARRRHRP